METKVLLKAIGEYPFVTNHTIYLTIASNALLLVRNNHLNPTLLQSFRRLVNSHLLLAMSESYSTSIVAFHFLASLDLNTSDKFK